MPQPKSQKNVGLGNALMHDRFGKGKGKDRRRGNAGAVTRVNKATGEEYITNEREEASWVKMRSVTEQGALDEFLATAELAGTDFTAEKMNNVKIIHTDQKNPYLLSATEERNALKKHKENREKLTVPRRPKWDENTSREELDALERESFLNWRRGLAELQENNDLLMTPFERNLEVWRQLWRVIERSDLVVQIVDARNPLMFRSEDLEQYVKDVDRRKENLLLINKADMMTYKQRKEWANYLKGAKIAYKFFSAQLAKEYNEARQDYDESEEESEESEDAPPSSSRAADEPKDHEDADAKESEQPDGAENDGNAEAKAQSTQDGTSTVNEEDDEDTRIITVEELESIFLQHAPDNSSDDHKITIGLVGYPNVGKSSTINALVGAKKVSVSSTPGKTKHFQTIHLSDKVVLCDCPGLVFPNFATTKAELVCNGVLPIDQLREFSGPGALVAKRIPKSFLEAVYGITIHMRPLEEGGTGVPTSSEVLRAYARARGFATSGQGNPDESRAARFILKDYVSGKLLWVEPPPGDVDAKEFNSELYDPSHLTGKQRLALATAMEMKSAARRDGESELDDFDMLSLQPSGPKTQSLDKKFFGPGSGSAGHVNKPFSYKYTEQGKAAAAEIGSTKHLSGRKARTMIALEKGLDPKDVQLMSGKKHFKGGPKVRAKKASNKEVDDF